jgi:hypothetical protein
MNESQRRYKARKKAEGTYNRGNRTSQNKRYYGVRELVKKAHQMTYRRLKRKLIIKPENCSICGISTPDLHGHHDNYEKPLDIIWVCWLCHNNLHKRR